MFCIYSDELLRRLAKSGIGCHVGHLSYAAIGYADDVILLSPSIHGLEDLVKICEQFASEYGATFNAKLEKLHLFLLDVKIKAVDRGGAVSILKCT